MYKIINDLADPNLKHLFRRCNEGDSPYELRNRVIDLILPKPKKEFLKRSFKYSGAINWNNLSTEAKITGSACSFIRGEADLSLVILNFVLIICS